MLITFKLPPHCFLTTFDKAFNTRVDQMVGLRFFPNVQSAVFPSRLALPGGVEMCGTYGIFAVLWFGFLLIGRFFSSEFIR